MVVCRLGVVITLYARVAEQADAQDLKSWVRKSVWVQVPPCAPSCLYGTPYFCRYGACNISIVVMTCAIFIWVSGEDGESRRTVNPLPYGLTGSNPVSPTTLPDSLVGRAPDFDSGWVSSSLAPGTTSYVNFIAHPFLLY